MVLNTSLAAAPESLDGALVSVPATDIANELGNIRVANMVMLGALNATRHLIRDKTIISTFEGFAGKVKPEIVKVNIEAYKRGRSLAAK
jgi:2-oxoglutarate ferredoxin oxidoreductase subunit gamma